MSTLEPKKDPILIDLPMPVESPRLILRPVMPGDGAATAAAIDETWDDLQRWMSWAARKEDNIAEKQEIRSRKVYAQFILREELNILALEKGSGRPVVWTGLHHIDWPARSFYLGYWTRREAQGRGYATESTNALLRYAFGALGLRRAGISHSAGNDASRRVIEKLGFAPQGVLEKATLTPDGALADSHHYALFSPDSLPPLDVRWGPP